MPSRCPRAEFQQGEEAFVTAPAAGGAIGIGGTTPDVATWLIGETGYLASPP